MKIFTTLTLLLILVAVGFLSWKLQNSPAEQEVLGSVRSEEVTGIKPSPSPSPFLFEEMTVPYLRNKEYKSVLGELDPYGGNGSYSSYLTSYISDGLKINGLLTKPAGEMPEDGFPAIVFVHGYIPPPSYKTTENYYAYVDYLASNGFVVFKIDLRGHGDSEGEPGGSYYSSDYIIDVLNARAALAALNIKDPSTGSGRFAVDANRIGIWGHSMAGNVTLRAIAADPEIPAVSIWAGAGFTYLDLAKYGIDDGSYRPPTNQTERQRKRQLLRQTYGDPVDGNPFWKLVSPVDYLKDYKGAIQLNHAVNDDVVNVGYSRDLNLLLEKTSIPHELNELPSGGHNIADPAFTPAMQKTVDFFTKYLE